MAKGKQARKSTNARRSQAVRQPSTPSVQAATPVQPTKAKAAAAPQKVDLAAEYHYVLSDLKRLGILAAAMLVTLVVLALVIH
jgi:hypothetical protein